MMVGNGDRIQFDFSADFADSNYKSCFARSVAVNSQFHSKSLDLRHFRADADADADADAGADDHLQTSDPADAKMKKDIPLDADERHRRLSCCSTASANGSIGNISRRGSDLPVENLALQTQVDTLQWQLKQAEASREMYRAVMKQVVTFLERAHRSLDILSERQLRTGRVTRSKSEYLVISPSATLPEVGSAGISNGRSNPDNYPPFKDFTWRKPKPQPTLPDEIPPEKLSQEAFRLLRTAQSLLSTRVPDLAHVSTEPPQKDQEFMSQLAREFPSRPQRTTSFSVNPQLVSPGEREIRIATAFNRKLSLQRTSGEFRRDSLKTDATRKEFPLASESFLEKRNSVSAIPCSKKPDKFCYDGDKASSPKNGSVSSADESGFSSLNSFHEVGIPVVNSSPVPHDDFKNEESLDSCDSNITQVSVECAADAKADKAKLIWNRPDVQRAVSHRRWSSTPVEVAQKDPLKVFWV